jgi:hypothetical protein
MPLNFPSSPATSTTYTFNNKTWTYNGNAWALSSGGSLNTSLVPEGNNLYYTNARARAAISVSGSGTYDSANGIITVSGGSTYGDSNVALLGYATNANVALKANIADLKTANVAELTNLYFTNARATAAVTNSTLSNITLSGNVSTGNVTVTGSSRLGTVTSGTWNGSSISTTYTDAKVTSVNGQTGAATGFATTANSLSQFASTTSAELRTLVSDETGSGSLVFATSPTLSGLTATGTTLLTTVGTNVTPSLRVGDTLDRNINFLANVSGGSYSPITTTNDSLIYFSAGLNTGNLVIAPWGSFNHGIKLNPVGNVIYLYGNIVASSNISSAAGNVSGNFTAGNFQSAGNVNASSALFTGSITAGTLQTTGSINAAGGVISSGTGRISFATDAGGSITLGNTSSQGASTPYLDFNTGATSVDYDSRIQGSGGTGVAGKGTLTFTTATAAFSANVTAGNVTLSSGGALTFPDGSRQTTAATAGVTTGRSIAMAIVFGS